MKKQNVERETKQKIAARELLLEDAAMAAVEQMRSSIIEDRALKENVIKACVEVIRLARVGERVVNAPSKSKESPPSVKPSPGLSDETVEELVSRLGTNVSPNG